MADSPTHLGEFRRDHYYTFHAFCEKLGMPPKSVRTKFINTGLLIPCKLARGHKIIPGYEAARFFDEMYSQEADG